MVIFSCFYPDIKILNPFLPSFFVGHERWALVSKGLSTFVTVDIFRLCQ